MWLRKGDQVVLVPEHMPETIGRCLGDGWVQIPDPTVPQAALPEPVPVHVPTEVAEKLEQERIAAIVANNDAARAAFADMGMGPKPRGRGRR